MIRIASIVEGDGEVQALPVLLRRLNQEAPGPSYADVLPPIRVKRNRFLNNDDEFRKQLMLAAIKCADNGWILILLDADDDCPAMLSQHILARAALHVPHRRISVVLANREYEAWFIASAPSLDGQRGFRYEANEPREPEKPRDAKQWVENHLQGSKYREVLDQPAFTATMDLQQAVENSRSFQKLYKEWQLNVVQIPSS